MTNLEQQDIEAFKSWANGTNPAVNPSYYQTWQAALAYERGKMARIVGMAENIKEHAWLKRFRNANEDNGYNHQSTYHANRVAETVDELLDAILPSPPATQPQEMEQ